MIHYIRAIEQYAGRCLGVVVNPNASPQRVVTIFFDRRMRKSYETKSGSEDDALYFRLDESAIVESDPKRLNQALSSIMMQTAT